MIRDQESAAGALADAIWWFKGFAAAQPEFERATPAHLAENLRLARLWLEGLTCGGYRLLGVHDSAFAIALTEAEFEQLWDALRTDGSKQGAEEREAVRARLKPVLDQFNAERRALADSRNMEVPF